MNNIVRRTEPCGTPSILTQGRDNEELIFTGDVLDEIKEINQLWT